jgi:uncharacterized membrane protein YeaQ/YmgE (transglycosylase-associated protein family)
VKNHPWVLFAMLGVVGAAAVASWTGRRTEADALACLALVVGVVGSAIQAYFRTRYRG